MKIKNHRHDRTSWIINGGAIEWCYVCGAFRHMKITRSGCCPFKTGVYKGWRKPSGDKDVNPWKSS